MVALNAHDGVHRSVKTRRTTHKWRSSGIVISVRVLGSDFGEALDASMRAAILDSRLCDLAKEALVVMPWNGCFQANREAATTVCLWPIRRR